MLKNCPCDRFIIIYVNIRLLVHVEIIIIIFCYLRMNFLHHHNTKIYRLTLERLWSLLLPRKKKCSLYSCMAEKHICLTSLSSQAVLVYKILNYAENPSLSTVGHGIGLAFGLFFSEFSKAFLISLLWALNLRTAVRLKGAFSSVAFQKVISLRVHSGISMGEVKTELHTYIQGSSLLNAVYLSVQFSAVLANVRVVLSLSLPSR